MKPKRLLFSALMLFAVLNSAKAFSHVSIKQEIISFVDTTEILVNNGRIMMIQSVQTGDFERVAEIYEFLNERTQINNCVAFSHTEMLHIALLTSNWDEFFARVANPFCTRLHSSRRVTTKVLCQSWRYRDHLATTLRTQVEDNASQILGRALMADLTPEQKEFLELYFYLIEHGRDETYSRKLRTFRRRYPQSEYNEFVSRHLPSAVYRGGMEFSFGVMQVFPTGNLAHYFAPATLPSISWGFQVNNLYFGFQFSGDVGIRLNAPLLSSETGYNHDFLKGDRFQYLHFEFPVGYTIFRNNRFEFLPFVSLGGTTIRSNLYRGEDNWRNREFFVANTFSVTPGLRAEFNLVDFILDVPNSLRLRLDIGYNIPVSYRFTQARGNIPYTRLALVWWFGN